jgi:hypothetical protein
MVANFILRHGLVPRIAAGHVNVQLVVFILQFLLMLQTTKIKVLDPPTVVKLKEHVAVLESIVLFGFEHAFLQIAHDNLQAQQIPVAHHGAGNHV